MMEDAVAEVGGKKVQVIERIREEIFSKGCD
jgi:hypothetical protein